MNKRNIVIAVGAAAVALAVIIYAVMPKTPEVDPLVVQMEQEIATYTGQIDSLTNVVDGLNNRIDRVRAQLDSSQSSNRTLVAALQRVTGEMKEYQKLYSEQRALNQKLSNELQQVRTAKDAALADKEKALAEVASMKTQMDSISNELYTKTVRIGRLENNLETALNQVEQMKETMSSVLLYVGTEDELKNLGYLKAWRPALFSKDYRILKFPEITEGQVPKGVHRVTLDTPFSLQGELEALADRHGKLDKGEEYQVQQSRGAFVITFKEPTLRGQPVLAIIKK